MKIKNLAVTNFKVIDSLKFEPKTINLIVGRNNTGKTSLLEAIDLTFNTEKIDDYGKNISELINVDSQSSEMIVELDNEKIVIKLEKPTLEKTLVGLKTQLGRLLSEDKKFDEQLGKEVDKEVDKVLNEKIDKEILQKLSKDSMVVIKNNEEEIELSFTSKKVRVFFMDTLKSIAENLSKRKKYHDSRSVSFIKSLPDESLGNIMIAIGSDRFRTESKKPGVIFIKELKKAGGKKIDKDEAVKLHKIEEYIKKHKLLKNLVKFDLDYLIFNKKGKLHSIPYNFMGDGFKAIVGLLWHLLSEKTMNKIVLIEEAENHMHPGYIRELVSYIIKFSKNQKIQFFITSHNSDFIASFFDEDLLENQKSYLQKEFVLLKMEKDGEYIIPEYSDYNDAKESLKDLLIDLRGI